MARDPFGDLSRRPVFWLGLAIILQGWILHQLWLLCWDYRISFLHSYFDDLCAVPLILGLFEVMCLISRGTFSARPVLPLYIIICIAALSFHFEILMPYLKNNYTRDGWDVLAYALGGLLYYSLHHGEKFHLRVCKKLKVFMML